MPRINKMKFVDGPLKGESQIYDGPTGPDHGPPLEWQYTAGDTKLQFKPKKDKKGIINIPSNELDGDFKPPQYYHLHFYSVKGKKTPDGQIIGDYVKTGYYSVKIPGKIKGEPHGLEYKPALNFGPFPAGPMTVQKINMEEALNQLKELEEIAKGPKKNKKGFVPPVTTSIGEAKHQIHIFEDAIWPVPPFKYVPGDTFKGVETPYHDQDGYKWTAWLIQATGHDNEAHEAKLQYKKEQRLKKKYKAAMEKHGMVWKEPPPKGTKKFEDSMIGKIITTAPSKEDSFKLTYTATSKMLEEMFYPKSSPTVKIPIMTKPGFNPETPFHPSLKYIEFTQEELDKANYFKAGMGIPADEWPILPLKVTNIEPEVFVDAEGKYYWDKQTLQACKCWIPDWLIT